MPQETPAPEHDPRRHTLTPIEQSRCDYARRDLESSYAHDLAKLPQPSVILLVERMRTRLDDMLNLVKETTNPPHDLPE